MAGSGDRARVVFGNELPERSYRKACRGQAAMIRRFGDDRGTEYHLSASPAPVVGSRLGARLLSLSDPGSGRFDIEADAASCGGKPVVVGNIRMGFGHYRIAMAMASAAHALGFTPYWFDLCGFEGSTCSKIVQYQNGLYSMGSRLSQKVALFDRLYWEPLNSEGFRRLGYNAGDQKNAELMTPVYADLPGDVPFIGTHAWPSQAAVHAGLSRVVNAVPDNWPMALHLAEGSLHTVQTQSAYMGYRMLRGMDGERPLKPMPDDAIRCVGHYVDHELVAGIEADCDAREERARTGQPARYLVCVGGAGAQQGLVRDIARHLLPLVRRDEAALLLNVGDHADVWEGLAKAVPELSDATLHFDDFDEVERFCEASRREGVHGVHVFCNSEIFGAVYSTNVLMRVCDLLVTKPSELAYYPVPKVMIHRVGGHEAWGAVRAAEVGDGTYELQTIGEIAAFVDAVQADRGIVARMCDGIRTAKAAGIYNGAYEVVRLATT